MNDEQLDQMVDRADRARQLHVRADLLDDVYRDSRRSRPSKRRTGIIGAAAGLSLALAAGLAVGPAAADAIREWLAVSEWQPEPGGEILPDSEMLELGAADIHDYVATAYPEWLPLPPSMTKDQLILDVIDRLPKNGTMQEVGVRFEYERFTYCGWVDAWLTSPDPTIVDTATRVLGEAVDWPAFNETDGGGTREFLAAYAAAAAHGDRDGVQYAAWQWGCSAWDGVNREWPAP